MNNHDYLTARIDNSLKAHSPEGHAADHCVVYTDGGARPNPGHSGFGIYATDSNGTTYNAWGGLSDNSTNNRAELAAYMYALKAALYFNWRNVTIMLDSKYVLDGAKRYIHGWRKNNWVKSDGNAIVNLDLWRCVDKLHNELKERGIKIKYRWVKGHSGVHGNEMADKNAEKGRLCLVEGKDCSALHIELKDAVKPVKKNKNKPKAVKDKKQTINRMIAGKRLLFTTNTPHQTKDGYYIYLSNSFEDNTKLKGKLLGRPASDNLYGVTILQEPMMPIETIIECQNIITPDDYAQPVIGMMDRITKPDNWTDLLENGSKNLSHKRYSILSKTGEPLTQYVRPAKRGYLALNILMVMLDRLDDYRFKRPVKDVEYVDITPDVYRKQGKKWLLQPDSHGKPAKKYTINVKHNNRSKKIVLTLGIDLPVRNNLVAIGREHTDLKVMLVKYDICKNTYRYCVIVEGDGDYAIYSTSEANLLIGF